MILRVLLDAHLGEESRQRARQKYCRDTRLPAPLLPFLLARIAQVRARPHETSAPRDARNIAPLHDASTRYAHAALRRYMPAELHHAFHRPHFQMPNVIRVIRVIHTPQAIASPLHS